LAILETQAVRDSLRDCLAENRPAFDSSPQPIALASQSSHHGRNQSGWVIAASVLLALAAGSLAGYQWADARQTPHSPIAPDLAINHEAGDIREIENNPMQAAAQSTLRWLNVRDEKLLALVRLDDGGKSRFVPIVSSETLADRLQETPTQSLSPERIQQANRNGWNVLQHQQLIAIDRPAADPEIVAVQMLRYKIAGRDAL
jgi:hypothetical protein